MQETQVWFLSRDDPLEKEMATHSSILAWKIPWMEESGGLQSMGSQRVGHDWVTSPHALQTGAGGRPQGGGTVLLLPLKPSSLHFLTTGINFPAALAPPAESHLSSIYFITPPETQAMSFHISNVSQYSTLQLCCSCSWGLAGHQDKLFSGWPGIRSPVGTRLQCCVRSFLSKRPRLCDRLSLCFNKMVIITSTSLWKVKW